MFPCVIPVQPYETPGPGPPSPAAAPAPASAQAITTTVKTPRRISASYQLSPPVRRRRCDESLRVLHRTENAERLPVDDRQLTPAWPAHDEMAVAVRTQAIVPDVLRLVLPRQVDADRYNVTSVECMDERMRRGGAVERVRPAVGRRPGDRHPFHRGRPGALVGDDLRQQAARLQVVRAHAVLGR